MQIGIDVTHLPWDKRGMGRYLRSILPHLPEVAPHLSFTAISIKCFPDWAKKELPQEIPLIELPSTHLFRGHLFFKKNNFDLLWFPWNVPSFLCKNIPYVATIHDVIRFRYPKKGVWGLKETKKEKTTLAKTAKHALRIIADAEFSKQEIARHLAVPSEKIKVIFPGVDSSKFFPRPEEETENVIKKFNIKSPYILFVGAIQPSKNVELLIDAFGILFNNESLVHNETLLNHKTATHQLVLVGKYQKDANYKEFIQRKIKKINLLSRVHILEEVSDEKLPFIYSGADLFVFPSCYEGFGLPPLEAMASGIPAIVSNAASLPEVAGDAALIVDLTEDSKDDNNNKQDNNKLKLAEACKKVIQDISLRENIVKRGLERTRIFTWERTAVEISTLFQELIHNVNLSSNI